MNVVANTCRYVRHCTDAYSRSLWYVHPNTWIGSLLLCFKVPLIAFCSLRNIQDIRISNHLTRNIWSIVSITWRYSLWGWVFLCQNFLFLQSLIIQKQIKQIFFLVLGETNFVCKHTKVLSTFWRYYLRNMHVYF